jgi:hypothetical protein
VGWPFVTSRASYHRRYLLSPSFSKNVIGVRIFGISVLFIGLGERVNVPHDIVGRHYITKKTIDVE